jgi:hypothetical protein
MKKARLPWTLRGGDFTKEGWHTEATAAYQLMFEFLRLSPSYELARRDRTGTLKEKERKLLPSDFDLVLKTYDLIGDVNCVLFRQWWLLRGLEVFGNPYTKPQVHKIAFMANGQETDSQQITNAISNSYIDTRHAEGLSASLIVSLPLSLKRSEIMRRLRVILDEYKVKEIGTTAQPKIKLMGKRFHANAMYKGLKLLWFKSAKPKWELWRLGAKAGLSESYSGILDPAAPRRTHNEIEMDDRITMGKITHRALGRFERIAENAARGRFPCFEPVTQADFNYSELAKRLLKHAQWIKITKAKWIADHQ